MIARTEMIRAHHRGNYRQYEKAGIEGVRFIVEWRATAGSRTCKQCASLDGQTFVLEDMRDAIPVHPNCRCCMIPVIDPSGKKGTPTMGETEIAKAKKAVGMPVNDPATGVAK